MPSEEFDIIELMETLKASSQSLEVQEIEENTFLIFSDVISDENIIDLIEKEIRKSNIHFEDVEMEIQNDGVHLEFLI